MKPGRASAKRRKTAPSPTPAAGDYSENSYQFGNLDTPYEFVAVFSSLAALMISVKAWTLRRLSGEIAREPDGNFNQSVADALENTSKIVLSGVGHTRVINTPHVPTTPNTIVLYSEGLDPYPDIHIIIDNERHAPTVEAMSRRTSNERTFLAHSERWTTL